MASCLIKIFGVMSHPRVGFVVICIWGKRSFLSPWTTRLFCNRLFTTNIKLKGNRSKLWDTGFCFWYNTSHFRGWRSLQFSMLLFNIRFNYNDIKLRDRRCFFGNINFYLRKGRSQFLRWFFTVVSLNLDIDGIEFDRMYLKIINTSVLSVFSGFESPSFITSVVF